LGSGESRPLEGAQFRDFQSLVGHHADEIVRKWIDYWCGGPADYPGSDKALAAVTKLTHADNVFYQARWDAVHSLACFHQPKAQEEPRRVSFSAERR
jgi:hypothetical protein